MSGQQLPDRDDAIAPLKRAHEARILAIQGAFERDTNIELKRYEAELQAIWKRYGWDPEATVRPAP